MTAAQSWQQRLREATSQAVFLRSEQPLVFIAHALLADTAGAAAKEATEDYVKRHRLQERLEEAITSLSPSSMEDPRLDRELAQALLVMALPKAEGGKLGVLHHDGPTDHVDHHVGPTETQVEAFLQKVGEPMVDALYNKQEIKWQGKKINDADCEVFAPGFVHLAIGGQLKTLHTLDLRMNSIHDKGLAALAAVFPHLPALKHLVLASNAIRAAGVKVLCDAFGAGAVRDLEHLDLSHNQVGDAGFTTLAEALGKGALPKLERLACNAFKSDTVKVGDDGLKAVAAALGKGALPALVSLDLQGNDVSDEGMRALAAPLAQGALPALQRLHMPRNRVGNAGLAALAGAVEKGALRQLTYLSLTEGISDVAPLAGALAKGGCPQLRTLHVGDQLGDAAVAALLGPSAPAAVFKTLEVLTLGGTMSAEGLKTANAAVAKLEGLQKLSVPAPFTTDASLAKACAANGIETPEEGDGSGAPAGLAGKTLHMYNRWSAKKLV